MSLFFLLNLQIYAQITHQVPAEFGTIQEAINTAESGDTVLVAPGTYIENINFAGKDIYLTSEFLYTGERSSIVSTIIDGSQPDNTDFGSVVRIVNGETNNAVLRGFTITGGTGTKAMEDGIYFRSGGGVIVDHSAPTIINNIIRNNGCMDTPDVNGAGGGGIRVGYGLPIIDNNFILENSGGYAGGIMIAYCEGLTLKNNVIAYNHSDGDFGGGGGIYVDWENVSIINNTVVFNHSDGTGGGFCITGNTSTIKNCIVYGNEAITESTASIRLRFGGNPQVDYTNISGGYDGTDNMDVDPMFIDTILFELNSLSPCVDAGDPDPIYNDQTDPLDPAVIIPLAKGGLRNDMGIWGGKCYQMMMSTVVNVGEIGLANLDHIELSYKGNHLEINLTKSEYICLNAFDRSGRLIEVIHKGNLSAGTHRFTVVNPGFQIIQLLDRNRNQKTIKVFERK